LRKSTLEQSAIYWVAFIDCFCSDCAKERSTILMVGSDVNE
jgi:hypothetical protein